MGRTPTGKPPSQPLTQVGTRHREIMRRLVAGETQAKIAKDLCITEGRLSVVCNSPLFKLKLKELEDEVKERFLLKSEDIHLRIHNLQPAAIDVLENILTKKEVDSKVVSLALKKDTALDILELSGNGKKKSTSANDAMADVVKIISDGFKLAKEMRELQKQEEFEGGNNGNGNGNGNTGSTSSGAVSPKRDEINVTPVRTISSGAVNTAPEHPALNDINDIIDVDANVDIEEATA